MNTTKNFLRLVMVAKQQVARASTEVTPSRNLEKLKRLQQKLQMDDGEPVHLKGGRKDKLLYQLTAAMCLVAVGLSLETFYKVSFGKK